MTQSPNRLFHPTTIVLFLVLLAFGLRVYGLTIQSLSGDEGITVIRSSEPLGELWRNMPVEHVHGYFVLVHGWFALAGDNDYLLRFLSVWPGVWAVAILYRFGVDLGRRGQGALAGLAVALLAATNVFQVWYAQEARMYSWMFALAALSFWTFWRLSPACGPDQNGDPSVQPVARPRDRRATLWAVYILATAGLVYLHYYSLLVPLLQTVIAVGWLARDPRRNRQWFLGWCAAGMAVLLLYAPLIPRMLDIFEFPGWREPLDPNTLPTLLFFGYTLFDYVEGAPATAGHWLYGLLALAGLVFWLRVRPAAGLLLLTFLGLGAAILYGLLLRNPDYHIRYSIYLAIPFYLAVAGGWTWLARMTVQGVGNAFARWSGPVLAGGLLLALVGVNGAALANHYFDETRHKADFREHAHLIAALGRPGDVILSMGPNPDLVFERYYTGPLPIIDITELATAPPQEAVDELAKLLAGKTRAWVLLRYFEPGAVQHYFANHGWPSPPAYAGDVRLTLYGLANGPLRYTAPDTAFGDALILRTGGVPVQATLPGLIEVETAWEVTAPPPELKFSMRLVDAAGEIVQALDYEPVNWFFPTSQWPVGETVVDRHAFLLTEPLPPGVYTVTVRLYDPANGHAVDTADGQDVVVGQVTVGA